MARIGKHKYKYDRYKNSGHKEQNKRDRAARNEKRIAKFAARKEDGKTYVYDKNKSQKKFKEFCKHIDSDTMKEYRDILHDNCFASNKNGKRGRDTEHAKYTSVYRKLNNEIEKQKQNDKKNDPYSNNIEK